LSDLGAIGLAVLARTAIAQPRRCHRSIDGKRGTVVVKEKILLK